MASEDERWHPDFEVGLAEHNLRAARVGSALAAILTLAGLLLDWLVVRDQFKTFAIIRVAAACLTLFVIPFTWRPRAKQTEFLLGLAPAFITSLCIQTLIELQDGYVSPYYAGHMQTILAVGVLYNWRLPRVFAGCLTLFAIWFVPALIEGPWHDIGPFVSNGFSLLVAVVITVATSSVRYQALLREHQVRARLVETSEALEEKSVSLEKAVNQLQELDRIKTQFFGNISHELRTPLTLILAPTEELISTEQQEDRRAVLIAVRRNAERLLKLIDELLDLSKIDAGGLRLNVASVGLRGLAMAVYESAQPAAAVRGIDMVFDAPSEVDGIFGDAHRLEIVITNLVGNALKYTDEGKITLIVRETPGGASMTVRDTGPGISAENLPYLFDRFFQVAGERRRGQGGVGIGLALARELVELHGGTLTVESELGKGTSFTVNLVRGREHFRNEVIERRQVFRPEAGTRRRIDPVEAEPKPIPLAAPSTFAGPMQGRVLVVDDHDEMRQFISSILQGQFVIDQARDGREALKAVEAQRPDLIVSDIMMPDMDGSELCRRLKTDARWQQIPVILLTARAGSEATLEAYAAGADDFVVKPFHPQVLMARVRAQLKIRELGLRLITQEKMFAVGTLAAGVAHEVRNPLNAIINASHTLLDVELDTESERKLLKIVVEGAERAEAIIGALDAHARPSNLKSLETHADVQSGVESTLHLLAHRLKNTQVHRSFAHTPAAKIPPGPLNQVVLNLLDNALRSGASEIWISTETGSDQVAIRVSDNGPGVPSEIAARIFDPFFTTRPTGEGTGLGLHLSRTMLLEHGGDLSLGSSEHGGATFVVRVPASPQ